MKIERLTPEQEAHIPEWVDKWVKIGLSTEPADFDLAEKAALRGYELASLRKPSVILRMGSPYSAVLGGALAVLMLDKKIQSNIGSQVESQVWSQVRSQVWLQVWLQVGSLRNDIVNKSFGGQLYGCSFCAHISFFRDICGVENPILDKFDVYEKLVKSCGWLWWHEDVLAISDRPRVLRLDKAGRLHCEDGPSIAYPDGWSLWHWHGVAVPEWVITSPQDITVDKIRKESNAEIRRVMMERYGYERYCRDAELQLVDSCPEDHPLVGLRGAKLWRDEANDVVLLDVMNSTPEPDGSVKRYVMAVDPTAYERRAGRECLAAMASTWRNPDDFSFFFSTPEEYAPAAES